jgi:hypothetical protein
MELGFRERARLARSGLVPRFSDNFPKKQFTSSTGEKQKMNANHRVYGAEIEAQQMEEEQEAKKIHSKANVVAATALQ